MKNEEEADVVNMTEEELQRFVRAQVENDERLVQRRAQLEQVEEWVKQKERQVTYNRLLYSNASESVLECESVMKGLYGMLGLKYQDTDSEEEGEGKQPENIIQIADDFDSEEDEGCDAHGDDDYVVIDLGGAVAEPEMETELKDDEFSEVIENSESSEQASAQLHSSHTTPTTSLMSHSKSNDCSTPCDSIPNKESNPSGCPRAFDNSLPTKTKVTPIHCKTQIKGNTALISTDTSTPQKKASKTPSVTAVPSTPSASMSNLESLNTTTCDVSVHTKQNVMFQTSASTQTDVLFVGSTPTSSETASLNQRSDSSGTETNGTSNTTSKTNDTEKVQYLSPKASSATCSSPSAPSTVHSSPYKQSKSSDSTQVDKPASSRSATKTKSIKKLKKIVSKQGNKPASTSSASNVTATEQSKSTDPTQVDKLECTSLAYNAVTTEKSRGIASKKGNKPASKSSASKAATTKYSKSITFKGDKAIKSNPAAKTTMTKKSRHAHSKQGNKLVNSSSASRTTNTHEGDHPKQGDTQRCSNLAPKATSTEKSKSIDLKKSDKSAGSSLVSNLTTTETSKSIDLKNNGKPSSSSSSPKVTTTEKSKSIEPKQDDSPANFTDALNTKPSTSTSTGVNPQLGVTNTSASDKASKTSSVTTSAKPPDTKDGSQTSLATSTVPTQIHQEVELKVNMTILGRRRTKTWHQGTILDIITSELNPRYKVLFEGGKGKSVLSAHHLACVGPPMLKDLYVGCRIVACYKEEDQSWFHAAIIAEMPDRRNRMRFLVFFDDGRPAYIALPDLHLVCKPLQNMSEDIEDKEWREELEEYLQSYPNPIFVVMRVGQETKVQRDGQLEPCTVTQVDGSLIQICYKNDQEKEWLYKGSNRLDQIQRIKKRMAEQKKEQSFNKAGWIPSQNSKLPLTTTTASDSTAATTVTVTSKPSPPQSVSTVMSSNTATTTSTAKTVFSVSTATTTNTAKTVFSVSTATTTNTAKTVFSVSTATTTNTAKTVFSVSTAPSTNTANMIAIRPDLQPKIILNRVSIPKPPVILTKASTHTEPTVTDSSNKSTKRPLSEEKDQSFQNTLVPVVEPRLKYVPHRCCPACLNPVRPLKKDQHRGQNPLLIPLLFGFRRMTARRRLDSKMSFHVFYRAPCGRSMCQMKEVQDFLIESRCDFLYLDMFCLDPFVLVKRALLPSSLTSQRYLFLRDLSHGKELVPIPCVNEIDSTPPPNLTYIRQRQPAPGVKINTQLDFMVGCDCTDGCRDRSKCACHQLTIEATSLFTNGPVDVSAGYTHKRLPRYVPTGVYECNPLCRCDPWLCGNRLVQHGIQLRLEVFMTQHKGWGIRCLDDISKGSFVCDFTGKITTDEMVSAEGATPGNEYLANLDYIEGVEKLKEGYESEAYSSETEESDKKTLVTMTTGALKKHGVFQLDSSSSSGEEKEEPSPRETEENKITGKRKRKAVDSDVDSEDDEFDDLSDEDYNLSSDDDVAQLKYTSSDLQRNYLTRRNAKTQNFNDDSLNDVQKPEPSQISEDQTQVTASVTKQIRKEGTGDSMMGFARKSTGAFAIKSSHRRVKQLETAIKSVPEAKVTHARRTTRSLFNEEKACYLIDAKKEGNLARYINHSCSPNLFVQNVFVDTHDLRFPWVAFFTNKRIRAGTELTWDYSYEVGSVEGKVLLCCCGSAECTGRLL